MARYDIPTASYNITIRRGAFNSYTIVFTDSAGAPEDMTGFTFSGEVKQNFDGSTAATFSADVTSISTGIIVMYLDAEAANAMPAGTYSDDQALEDPRYGVFNFEMTDGAEIYRITEGNVVDSRDAS